MIQADADTQPAREVGLLLSWDVEVAAVGRQGGDLLLLVRHTRRQRHRWQWTCRLPCRLAPATVHSGVDSFVIRAADRTAWRSAATAAWLIVENEGAYWVDNGTVLVVTEGARDVAYFHVRQVMSGSG